MTAQSQPQIQYVSDEDGQPVSVLVPIELWREIASERETAHLLKDVKPPRAINLEDEPFIGMWADREDLEDSSQAVRESRKAEWGERS